MNPPHLYLVIIFFILGISTSSIEESCGTPDLNLDDPLNSSSRCKTNLPDISNLHHEREKLYVFILEPETVQFVKEYFEERSQQWELLKKTSDQPNLNLIYSTDESNQKIHNDHIVTSFWPMHSQFSNKYNFYRNAERLNDSGLIKDLSLSDVMLPTYFFDMNQPKLTDEEKDFFHKHKSGVWIKKPVEDSRCKGVELFRDLKQFHSKVGKKKPFKKPNYIVEQKSWIVQKYIENSLLIDGKKFDVRCFVLIASFQPYVMLYNPGYIRRSLDDFSLADLSNKMIHCVNQSIQMKHRHYEEKKDDTIWTIEKFEKWLVKKGQDPDKIQEKIKKRIVYSGLYQKNFINQGNEQLHQRKFHLFGVDISFSDKFNPYVIEFNASIQLNPTSIDSLNTLLKEITRSMLDIETKHILHNSDPYAYFSSEEFNEDLRKTEFSLMYNEAREFSMIE